MVATAPQVEYIEEFSRYEFKYLLDADLCTQIEKEISAFMRYDGYVHEELGNAYLVRSLYFDDAARTHYYEKIDGQLNRKKYRLRTYSQEMGPDVPIFLEQKGRYNQRVYKNRIPIAHDDLENFLDPFRLADNFSEQDGDFVTGFLFESLRRRLAPVVLVDYIRRPYVSDYDMNFRVTFDSQLSAAATGSLFPGDGAVWQLCEPGRTIVEIKFNRRIPAWFHRIVQAYDLRRLSISKFCRGMEVNNLAERLE